MVIYRRGDLVCCCIKRGPPAFTHRAANNLFSASFKSPVSMRSRPSSALAAGMVYLSSCCSCNFSLLHTEKISQTSTYKQTSTQKNGGRSSNRGCGYEREGEGWTVTSSSIISQHRELISQGTNSSTSSMAAYMARFYECAVFLW